MSVASLLSDAKAYTATLVGEASGAMDEAITMVRAVGYVIPGYFPATTPSVPPTTVALVPPTLETVTLDMPAEPANTLAFQDISAIETGVLPTLTAVAPTITLPTTPSALAEFTTAAPGLSTDIVFPEPPSELLAPTLAAPTLPVRDEPTRPDVVLPSFDAEVPTDLPVAPTDYESRFAASYDDAAPSMVAMLDGYVDAQLAKVNPQYFTQMAAIEAQLTRYLAGGTGLNATVENAIYERARSKNDAEARRVMEAAWSTAAERGFTMAGAFLGTALTNARQSAADNNATASREIVVMQAEMEQKNLQFAVTTSTGLRTAMLNATLSYMQNLVTINGQALDYAKTVLSAIIEVYNTAVKAFGIKLDAYRAQAVVYETRLKAATSYIELYQAEINALAALTTMDRAKVDVYRARIEALTSLSNVYRAQIEAVQGRVSLEKLQLDVFRAQVEAYSAQVSSKNAQFAGYTAAVEGQTAAARIYNTQVDGYVAQVQAYKVGIDAKSAVVQAQVMANAARATQYEAAVRAYSTVVNARGEKARTVLENQRLVLAAFDTQVKSAVSFAQIQNDYYRAVSTVAISNADLRMRAQIATIDSTRNFGDSMARLGTANATIYANLAGAAMSGMNTLASESVQQS